jgi:hypothetical protein
MNISYAGRAHDRHTLVAIGTLLGILALWPVAAFAQAPVRLSDQQIKKLIDQVWDARDSFEGTLDDSVKESMMKTATTDAKVLAVLQDLQDNAGKLRDRFKPDYAAGAEVETLLKQATLIGTAMDRARITKGRSQWDELAASLKSLGGAYGATFPLPDGAGVRRLNDGETAAAAGTVASAADQIKKQIDKSKELAKPDKEAGKKAAEAVVKAADTLKSKIADGKTATGELRQVSDLITSLRTFLAAHPMPSAAAAASTMNGAMGKLQQSFLLPPAAPTTN